MRAALIDRQGRLLKRLPAGIEVHPDSSRPGLLHVSTKAAPMLVHLDGRRRPMGQGADIDAYKARHAIARGREPGRTQAAQHNGMKPARKGKLWGLVDASGKWVSPPVLALAPHPLTYKGQLLGWYTRPDKFSMHPAGMELDAWLSPEGKLVAGGPRYSAVSLDPAARLLTVSEDDRYDSVLSSDGVVRIGPVHAALTPLRGGWFLAEPRRLHGLVDQRGAWQIAPRPFGLDGQSLARPYLVQFKGRERELMDLQGRVSTRAAPLALGLPEPSESWWIDFTLAPWETGYTQFNGFDFKPRVRIPGTATAIQFSEGVIGFEPSDPKLAGYVGLADDSGKTLGLYRHASVGAMRDAMAVTSAARSAGEPMDLHYGYIDRAGKLAIAPQFDQAGDFSEGRATVVIGKHLALIDKAGRVLLQGGWQCGRQEPVLLDAMKNVIWPQAANKAGKCKP